MCRVFCLVQRGLSRSQQSQWCRLRTVSICIAYRLLAARISKRSMRSLGGSRTVGRSVSPTPWRGSYAVGRSVFFRVGLCLQKQGRSVAWPGSAVRCEIGSVGRRNRLGRSACLSQGRSVGNRGSYAVGRSVGVFPGRDLPPKTGSFGRLARVGRSV